jgi:hypothetical protein
MTGISPNLASDRLPRPPGRRRPGVAALAILLIVGSAAAAGVLALRLDSRTPMLMASKDLDVGHRLEKGDLAAAPVAATGVQLVAAADADRVVGQYVLQQIPAGRLLDSHMFGANGLFGPGQVAVGIPLTSGRAPATGFQSGDVVNVVHAVNGQGTLLAANATIGAVVKPDSGGFGSTGGGVTVATVIVKDDGNQGANGSVSTQIAAAAAADQIVLVLVSRGSTAAGH